MISIETKVNQLTDEVSYLNRINAQLKTALHQSQVAHAATKRLWTLKESGLSESSVARLNAAFANSTDNAGLKQAINCEQRGAK